MQQQTKNNAPFSYCSKVWSVVIWPQLPLKIYRQSSHQEVLLVAAAAAAETHEISHAVSFPSALDTLALTQKANP
jgi:hypothetical protein